MMNPVVERELLSALRSPKAIAMQVVPALAGALLVLLRWPAEGQVDFAHSQSQQVFHLFGYGLLTALVLMVPAFPAISIVGERLSGTLALLLHTPLRAWSICLGKLAGVLGVAYLPLFASAPAAAACYAMGGIAASDILILYGILALATLQFTALALWVSSHAGSIDSAVRITYGLVLTLTVFTLGPYQVLQGMDWPRLVTASFWLRAASPLPAVMEVLGHGDVTGMGLIAEKGSPLRYAILALATTVLCVVATAIRLRPTLFDRPRPQGPITEERGFLVRTLRRMLYVVDPQRRSGLIGPFTNPVMVKEFRCRRFGRSYWLLRLMALCFIGSLGLTLLSATAALDWGTGTIMILMVALQGSLVVLLTPSLAAGLISAEVESGGWTLLQMTPLSAGRILRGKLLSVAWTVSLILVATLPGYGVMVYAKPAYLTQVLYVLFCLALTGLFALALSAAVSSLCARTAPATLISYGILLAIYCGTLLVWVGADTTFGHSVVEQALTINPLAAALSVMEVKGFKQYRLVPDCWYVVGGATLACLVVLRFRVWRLMRPQ
jgi:ABC-type transport system involved in multi-copper enzyme maturation permease subunit